MLSLADELPAETDPDTLFDGVRGLGGGPRAGPVPASGRGADRGRLGQQRDPEHADRLGQEPGRGGRALRRAGPGRAVLLHRADQGAGVGEVLRPVRAVRRGPGRHDDRRRERQPGRADHLLHRGDPGQHRAAGRGRGRRPAGRDGRVPLLRRPGARLGLAGPAGRAGPRPVHPDVGHAGRRQPVRAGPDPAHRPAHRGGALDRPAGAAAVLLRAHAAARDAPGAARHQAGPGLRRALHPGRGARAGPGADEHQRLHPGGEGRDRRPDRQLPVRARVRQGAVPAGPARHRRAPRRDAAEVPAAGGDPGPGRPAEGRSAAPTPSASASTSRSAPWCSPGCPSTTGPGPGCSRPASSTRSPGGPDGPATTPWARSSSRPPSTWWRTRRPWPRPATTPRSGARWCARSRRRAPSATASRRSSGWSRPTPSRCSPASRSATRCC